jgi:hypothetical protein
MKLPKWWTPVVAALACLPARAQTPSRTLYINFQGGHYTHYTGPFWDQDLRTGSVSLCGTCEQAGFGDFPPLNQPCRIGKSDCRRGTCAGKTYDVDTVNGVLVPYGRCSEPDPDYHAEVLAGVRLLLAPFNVAVVDRKPAAGDYDMVLFNANITCDCGGPGGSAIMGCGLSRRNELLYAQQATLWEWETWQLASFIAHEFGHTMGLVHNAKPVKLCDPMSDLLCKPQKFQDACVATDGNNACRTVHDKFCPGGQQNTFRLMQDVLGKSTSGIARRPPMPGADGKGAVPGDVLFIQGIGAPAKSIKAKRIWSARGERLPRIDPGKSPVIQ